MLSKIYNCSLCLYNTDLKYNFNRHMKLKHSINNEDTKNNNKDNKDIIKDIIEVNNEDNKCVKCDKILSSKYYLQKHLITCKGVSNPLECHLCHKIFSDKTSKSHHLKICKKNPSNNCIVNTDNELLTDGLLNNYIYLLREREFIKTNEPVYKIGKTKQEKLKRYNKYPKGSHLLLHISCFDCDIIEKTILSIFKEKFIHKKDIGYEYFEGNYIDMMRIITNIILNNCQSFKNK
jgi:hypothetical protein